MNKKVLFIISSTAQAEMFFQISKYLTGFDIKAINTNILQFKADIEKVLMDLNFPFETIKSIRQNYIGKLITENQPLIMIFGHDRNDLDKLFIKEANSRGIPTLLVQDGILAASRDRFFETGNLITSFGYWLKSPKRTLQYLIRDNQPWKNKIETVWFELKHGNRGKSGVYGHGECSKIAVFGEAIKRILISEGIDSQRIVVTGNPKFDKIFHASRENSREYIYQKYNIPPERDILLLLTSYFVEAGIWSIEQRRDFVLAVAGAASKLPDTQLIIKLHPPYENEKDYDEIVKNLTPKPIICKYANLPELINACNLSITVSSTAGLEAMAMGKPVLIIDDNVHSFYSNSGAIVAKSFDEIFHAMQKSLYDSSTREKMKDLSTRFVVEQAYLQDGQASHRIADLIRNMAIK